jgi:hypothetical protein
VFCCDSAVGTEAADISVLLQTIAGTCRQVRQLSWTGHYTTDLNFASALAAVLTTSTCMTRLTLSDDYKSGTAVAPKPRVLAEALA